MTNQKNKILYLFFVEQIRGVPRNLNWQGDEILVLTDRKDTCAALSRIGIPSKTLDDYRTAEDTHMEAMREAAGLLERLGDTKLAGETTLNSLLTYKDICLWKMSDVELTMYLLTEKIDKLNVLLRAFETEQPARIAIFRSSSDWAKIAAVIARSRLIEFSTISAGFRSDARYLASRFMIRKELFHLMDKFIPIKDKPFGRIQLFLWIPKPLFYFFKSFERLYKRLRSRRFKSSTTTSNKENRKIILVAPVKRYANSVIPVARVLQRQKDDNFLIIDSEMIDAYKFLSRENLPNKIIYEYYTGKVGKEIANGRRSFEKKWHFITASPEFGKAFKYREIDLWKVAGQEFKVLFFYIVTRLVDIVDLTFELIKRDNPSLLVTTDDCASVQRTMIEVFRRNGIRSLDLLVYSVSEHSFTWKNLATDFVALEGDFARRVFLSCGISEGRLFITGQPRFDFVPYKDKVFNADRIYNKLGISRDKKIVTLTTNPVVINIRENEKVILLREVYGALKELGDYHLVVKLHPSDFDGTLEKAVARDVGLTNVTIARDVDIETFELFYVSDLVITTVSTTGPEAIVMDRLLIQVTLSQNEPAWMPCASSGAALGVDRQEMIKPTILDALKNLEEIKRRLSPYRERFVTDQYYRLDGRSAERVVNLMDSLIKTTV